MRYRREELRFNGWGRTDKTFDLKGRDAEVWAFVSEALGMRELPHTPAVPLESIDLPPSALDGEMLARLRDITEVLTSMCARLYGRRAAKNRAARAVAVATGEAAG